MKVIICGDRNWTDEDKICKEINKLPLYSWIIQGECSGADLLARKIALNLGYDVVGFPANWKKYGKKAGRIRNQRMLQTKPDLVIAFHSNLKNSKGTKHMVNIARRQDIKVRIIS